MASICKHLVFDSGKCSLTMFSDYFEIFTMAEQAEENNAMNVQMEQMMRDYKLAQNRQMEIFKAQMKAQKELNRF